MSQNRMNRSSSTSAFPPNRKLPRLWLYPGLGAALVLLALVASATEQGQRTAAQGAPPAQSEEQSGAAGRARPAAGFPIHLKSRIFTPSRGLDSALSSVASGPRHGLIQFKSIPTAAERRSLGRAGVELFTYIPERAFLARLPADLRPVLELPNVSYVGPLLGTDKIDARILKDGANPFARQVAGRLRLSVLFFEDVRSQDAATVIERLGGRITQAVEPSRLFEIDLPEASLSKLLAEDGVQWIEDVFEPQILNDGARGALGVDAVHAAPYGLDGTGVVLGEWDGGHAISTANVIQHQDLLGRVTRGDTTTAGNDGHATHVAGTAIGSGALSSAQGGAALQWKGMAPDATLIAYDWNSFLAEYTGAINTHQIDLSTNSWHNGGNGVYTSDSRTLDQIITGSQGKKIPILWAAGNQRGYANHLCDVDFDANKTTRFDAYDCIVNLASAKNTLSVGATNSNDLSMTSFSSWGPTNDGRLKPEIVAPGCEVGGDGNIKSTVPGNTYGNSCGTSMATPAAAGSVAVLLQRFGQLCPASGDPLPSTVKALLVHTARDLDDATAWYNRGPDYSSGYGHLDLPRAVDLIPFHRQDTVSQGGVQTYSIVVPPQTDLKVTLVWDDPAASPSAAISLVNDLDLELVDPASGIHLPWILNPASPAAPATRGADHRNVVEQVVVDTVSSALAGTWTIRVKGTNVPSLSQSFSLVSELLPASSCAGPPPAADVWGADTPQDNGTEPNLDLGPMWISEDIRVRLAPADGPHQNPELGQTNHVFVTVRNRGAQTAPYARVFVYWADASTGGSWPIHWNLLGSATAVSIPAGGNTVVGPIPWNPVGTGHYCLHARMVTFNEPFGPETSDINANTKQFNQVIWKNVTVVDNLQVEPFSSTFLVRNPRGGRGTFNLAFQEPAAQRDDPFVKQGEVVINLGKPLWERWQRSGGRQRGLRAVRESELVVVEPGRAELLGLKINGSETFTLGIRFTAKGRPRCEQYRFDVVQENAVGGNTVGGVSFFLAPDRDLPASSTCGCAQPPRDMYLWLPFDEAAGPTALNAAGPVPGTHVGGPTPEGAGKVARALCFDGTDDRVEVPSYGAINFSTGSFSLDAWVIAKPGTESVSVIVDKRTQTGQQVRGYSFFLYNGALALQLADGGYANYISAAKVPNDGKWHHVAVTVERTSGTGGRFYLDGQPAGTPFNPTGHTGSVSNTAPLRVGARSALASSGPVSGFFRGCIDELEAFRRVLSPAEVLSLYQAGPRGKCKRSCTLPAVTPFCGTAGTVTVTARVCNARPVAQTLTYGFNALPVQAGCAVPGPTSFSPISGLVTVPPGKCQNVQTTIARPAGLTANGSTSCYEMTVQDSSTGETSRCRAALEARTRCDDVPIDLDAPIEDGF